MASYQNDDYESPLQQDFQANRGISSLRSMDIEPADCLASVAPRVINLAIGIDKLSGHLESSFGIARNQAGQVAEAKSPKPTQATLMSQLQMIESVLMRANSALDNINRHVNG